MMIIIYFLKKINKNPLTDLLLRKIKIKKKNY